MRGVPTRRDRKSTISPTGLMLVVIGLLALAYIVTLPAGADAHAKADGRYLDGAGTASLVDPPVEPVAPTRPAPRLGGDGESQQGGHGEPRQGGEGDAGSSAVPGGGIGLPGLPKIKAIRCLRQCVSASRATRGSIVAIRGRNLDRVTRVIFHGRKGKVRVRWRKRSASFIRVTVPKRAVGGRIAVVDAGGNKARSPRALRILPISSIPIQVFPVRGSISFGSSGSRFGAGRSGHSHQGQDVSASCGTRLVSVRKARVLYNQWDDGGGNYVVLHNVGTRTNFVYMHMLRRSRLRVGQLIGAGTPIGRVGNTGSSYGCHLHFEYWIGPWQTGGRPIDPLPYLRSLLG